MQREIKYIVWHRKISSSEPDQNISGGGSRVLWNNCTHCELQFRYTKLPQNGAAETASSAQLWEGVAQGKAFVLDFSNFYQNHKLGSAWISPKMKYSEAFLILLALRKYQEEFADKYSFVW